MGELRVGGSIEGGVVAPDGVGLHRVDELASGGKGVERVGALIAQEPPEGPYDTQGAFFDGIKSEARAARREVAARAIDPAIGRAVGAPPQVGCGLGGASGQVPLARARVGVTRRIGARKIAGQGARMRAKPLGGEGRQPLDARLRRAWREGWRAGTGRAGQGRGRQTHHRERR